MRLILILSLMVLPFSAAISRPAEAASCKSYPISYGTWVAITAPPRLVITQACVKVLNGPSLVLTSDTVILNNCYLVRVQPNIATVSAAPRYYTGQCPGLERLTVLLKAG